MRMAATLAGAEAFGTAHRHATQTAFPFGTSPAGRWERGTEERASSAALAGLVRRACQHIVTSLAVGVLHLAMMKYILLTIGAG
jgi:hypothetical protein